MDRLVDTSYLAVRFVMVVCFRIMRMWRRAGDDLVVLRQDRRHGFS